jgi:hypothetical protein
MRVVAGESTREQVLMRGKLIAGIGLGAPPFGTAWGTSIAGTADANSSGVKNGMSLIVGRFGLAGMPLTLINALDRSYRTLGIANQRDLDLLEEVRGSLSIETTVADLAASLDGTGMRLTHQLEAGELHTGSPPSNSWTACH